MANFVHNEPTSLTTIQEKKMPEKFFALVEDDIEANFEVIASIANAIGAICLNQTGLDLFNSKPNMIPRLINLIVSKRHIEVMEDRENANIFGTAMDELVRHQPSIKEKVINAVLDCLRHINQKGAEWSIEKDEKLRKDWKGKDEPTHQIYSLALVDEKGQKSFTPPAKPLVTLSDLIMDEADRMSAKQDPATVNTAIASMDAMARFLEAFFQTPTHCKDFIRADGLDLILSFYELPCIPYNFSASFTADSLFNMMRMMVEMSSQGVLGAVVKEVRKSLAQTQVIWNQSKENNSGMLPLLMPGTEEELAEKNAVFRSIVALNVRLNLLTDLCQHLTYSGSRLPSTFLTLLNAKNDGEQTSILEDLGQLLQDVMWETLMLKASTPAPPAPKKEGNDKTTKPSTGLPEDIVTDVPGALGAHKKENEEVSESGLPESLKQNSLVLRYLASQMPACLNFLTHEVIRLLFRRTADSFYRSQANLAAEAIAKILACSLRWRDSPHPSNNLAFATMMIDYADGLMYDAKNGPMGANLNLIVAFDKAGGVERLLELFQRYTGEIDLHFEGDRKLAESDEDAIRLGHACGGLRVALHLMQTMVSGRSLTESPQLSYLSTTKDGFEPRKFLIKVRTLFLRAINSIWEKDWLFSLPLLINRWLVKIVLVILKAEHEEEPPEDLLSGGKGTGSTLSRAHLPPASASSLSGAIASLGHRFGGASPNNPLSGLSTPRPPTVADEARVAQLVEMGFPAASARRALQRTHNAPGAALEYLLTVSGPNERAWRS